MVALQLESQEQKMGRKKNQASHVLAHVLAENAAKQCVIQHDDALIDSCQSFNI